MGEAWEIQERLHVYTFQAPSLGREGRGSLSTMESTPSAAHSSVCGAAGAGGFPGRPRSMGRCPPGAWEAAGILQPCNYQAEEAGEWGWGCGLRASASAASAFNPPPAAPEGCPGWPVSPQADRALGSWKGCRE